jgi:16S rRNA (cytosine1402-N4)-methyltransferase
MLTENPPRHEPVMPAEAMECLAVRPDGVYADVTCGLGGHTRLIADRLGPAGLVVARDRDEESLAIARSRLEDAPPPGRIVFDHGTFSTLRASLDRLGVGMLDGLLADCGVSLYQLTDPARGFSLTRPGPLDMRASRSQQLTAADIVNTYTEREIADIVLQFGEERRGRRVSGAIVRARPIHTTDRLAEVVAKALGGHRARIHPATRVFQALRIAVNSELEELEDLAGAVPLCVRPGGRVVAISFHSGEDRILKRAFQALARAGRARPLHKHVLTPGDEELRRNAASRPAKLRAIEIL